MTNDTNPFYDAVAQHYTLFFRDWETQMEREGLGLRSIFRNQGVSRVLDASCGAGVQSIPLAKLGFDVTAADPSEGMLIRAREIAAAQGVQDKIAFVQSDFLNLLSNVQAPFDAVITKGSALPHLLLDQEIETALRIFNQLLRVGGLLVIGMRDFADMIEDRPRFIPGLIHDLDNGHEFVTFDIWEWEDGPPITATQNLYIVQGDGCQYETVKRSVVYRPLSTDEVKVVLLESGFDIISDQPDRSERVMVARKQEASKTYRFPFKR